MQRYREKMLVFCSGMLRSGSAFQYNLVCSLLEKTAKCCRHGRWEPKSKFTYEKLMEWAKDENCFHVIKSGRFEEEFQLSKAGLAKITYISRDIRDIAVAAKYKWGLEGKELIVMLDRALGCHNDMEVNNAFEAPWCLCQRYEDVYNDKYKAVLQLQDFLGISATDTIIYQTIDDCKIERMIAVSKSPIIRIRKQLLLFLGKCTKLIKRYLPYPLNGSWNLRRYYLFLIPKVDQRTVIAARHIEPTKGVPGAWRTELSEIEINEINKRYAMHLKQQGYT